ncbi:cell division control protein 6 homolog isoform X1 [Apostichopus japonicus]|uniref:cell division control protein 6 homolog isoform X1 n=1 Tax=Stichopus japonicus TaxID=307972 RepID=UPI003AB45ECD
MPITTRSRGQVQSTLQFKQRKSRGSGLKASKNGMEDISESKGISKAKYQNTSDRAEVKQETECKKKNELPTSPRKRPHSRASDKENKDIILKSPCSPIKIMKSSPLKSPLKGLKNLTITDSPNQSRFLTPKKAPKSPRKLSSPSSLKKCWNDDKAEGQNYTEAKRALHTSLPDRLLCRDEEVESIQGFLHSHIVKKKPGSLYISGAPGTGKTACLKYILEEDEDLKGVKTVFVNCMSVRRSQGIYIKILREIDGKKDDRINMKDAQRQLQKKLSSPGPVILLVLDEIDHLDSKGQEVLYTMFEWPSLPKSRLVLLGIANALDLTDRILPRLQARPKCAPKLLHFQPYTKNQIVSILQDRLEATEGSSQVLDPVALQLCARKVAAVSGDIRKALDVCRRAVEVTESDQRTLSVLSPTAPRQPGSPKKSPKKKSQKVNLQTISSVLGEVYGSNIVSSNNQSQTFPLQQKLVICTLLLTVKEGKRREVTLGKLHESYCKICLGRQVPAVDQSEFSSLCQLIETRGIMGIKASKDMRQTKINLKLSQKEVEFALQDKVILSSILQQGLPNSK